MILDITLPITREMLIDAQTGAVKAPSGHLGTHFDVMNKEFPLEYTERPGIVFDVSAVGQREIGCGDVALGQVQPGMFVAFYTGFIEAVGYGGRDYFGNHPQLAHELIDALLDRSVSIIGLDFAGVRRGKEHIPKDQVCADRGVFVVENLCNLRAVLAAGGRFTACTYPLKLEGLTGLPCRVVARV